MTMLESLKYFHLIRPYWLMLVPAVLLLWWWIRPRTQTGATLAKNMAPHLAEALTVGGTKSRKLYPIDGVALAAALLALAAAGPAWDRIPNPLVADTAAMTIVLKVADAMEEVDVPPSRMERARQKIVDLVQQRSGSRTALVAYAGTAHRVLPLTEDPALIKPFIEGLSPEIMPQAGNNLGVALELAQDLLATEETPGTILLVTDDIDSTDQAALERHNSAGGATVLALLVNGSGNASASITIDVVSITPDTSDVETIDRLVQAAYQDVLSQDERLAWNDRGWWLALPAALLILLWFRRGWTMRWAFLLLLPLSGSFSSPAHALDLASWFYTPDQQGQIAYNNKQFSEAAELFQEPKWRGTALYRAGKYEDAAKLFSRLPDAEAAYSQGLSHMRSRGYRPAIAAFEKALELKPDYAAAARNLEIARAVLEYVETAREQSDTGEESGIGADDVVFDNEAGRGEETQIAPEENMKPQTAEQWMRSVDTKTSDYLKMRFALEAAESNK